MVRGIDLFLFVSHTDISLSLSSFGFVHCSYCSSLLVLAVQLYIDRLGLSVESRSGVL